LKKIERINDALKNHDVFKNYEEYIQFLFPKASQSLFEGNLSLKLVARTTCATQHVEGNKVTFNIVGV